MTRDAVAEAHRVTREFGWLCLDDPEEAMRLLMRHGALLFVAGTGTGTILGLLIAIWMMPS